MLITQALSELKLINNKLESNWNFIERVVIVNPARQNQAEIEKVSKEIKETFQSIKDLSERFYKIKSKITESNTFSTLQISLPNGKVLTKTVTEWLIWKRDVLPAQMAYYNKLTHTIDVKLKNSPDTIMEEPTTGIKYVAQCKSSIDAMTLKTELEELMYLNENLDAALSIHNATRTIVEI